MIDEPDRMLIAPGAISSMVVLPRIGALPLLDPEQAAKLLKVQRHSLACYRSLGVGPPFFKLGRWIRYARCDLLANKVKAPRDHQLWSLPRLDEAEASGRLLLVNTDNAAKFLTLTKSCLFNHRRVGGGPGFIRLGRRIIYPVVELERWALAQRLT